MATLHQLGTADAIMLSHEIGNHPSAFRLMQVMTVERAEIRRVATRAKQYAQNGPSAFPFQTAAM